MFHLGCVPIRIAGLVVSFVMLSMLLLTLLMLVLVLLVLLVLVVFSVLEFKPGLEWLDDDAGSPSDPAGGKVAGLGLGSGMGIGKCTGLYGITLMITSYV